VRVKITNRPNNDLTFRSK